MNFFIRRSPQSLKIILTITLVVSFLSSLLPSWNPLIYLFSLSIQGVFSGYIWQIFTYSFLEVNFLQANLFYLLHMFFYGSLFWILGSAVIRKIQEKEFMIFYCTTILISGLVGLIHMYLTGIYSFIFGMSPILYAIVFTWIYFYPYLQFSIAYKIYPLKWIVLALLVLNLYLDGSNGNWTLMTMNLSAILWSYILLKLRYNQPSPFPFIQRIEQLFMRRDF